ncbi:uncharacterized protein LOC110702797 [Chenopodium quinoa]|uniref:uncharacterized protein LOC110702797 n=1 Tax=Chenopodium quinoa TaxID=63459 RepID=UPI000B777BD8|nr:uncharacterized protein LOC110702797 [Chenopodium quinoa]
MGDKDSLVDICLRVGGAFVPKRVTKNRQLLCWCGGWCYWKRKVQVSKLDVHLIRTAAIHGFVNGDMDVPMHYSCWYRQKGKTFNTGKRELVNSEEVKGLLETVNEEGYVEVFVTTEAPSKPIQEAQPNPAKTKKKDKKVESSNTSTIRRSPRFKKTETEQREESPPRKASANAKVLRFDEEKDDGCEGSGYSSSDLSDEGQDWEPGEEEFDEGDEEWYIEGSKEILAKVNKSLRKGLESAVDDRVGKDKRVELRNDLDVGKPKVNPESDADSDDSRSLCGSDEEQDYAPWFNADVDFDNPIKLKLNQKFSNASVLRRALRLHAIQNRYEFYYLHNDSTRVTVQCRYRCGCEFNSYTCRMPACTCVGGVKCQFKVFASKLVKQQTWQIKTLNLDHSCFRVKKNKMLTAEYIAERYLEEFRSNPGWRIKEIRARILNDLGVDVSYYKAWLARCRAKLLIFGSAREQYARVWDYGKAVMKYNPGSGCNVVVDGIDRPEPPLFMRMFICLRPLRDGFAKGCRPLIGLDGCHLKGAFPGQILVAVAKDGNNNLFPLAWATVEIENQETWGWFLESLMSMFTHDQGAGLTIMSDRQKGLIKAMADVIPKAEQRFCVRHIWANFKLNFTGSTFKELFWRAARATTIFEHEIAMESIKFLDEEAYEYLINIPPHHWSRHAFTPNCKSNMLLNNMCETFNAVIRPARDKPILTQMEWMRRYIMNRNNEKWEDSKTVTHNLVPYVRHVLGRIDFVARSCVVQPSRGNTFEVQLKDDQVLVDLDKETCTCYHWELTGIPCVHAYACILDMRGDIEAVVDPYYTMDTYRSAYEPAVQPMPGPKHWERVRMREPLPPSVKVQPGRPKSKKRKLEPGECSSSGGQASTKRKKQCSNCEGFRHYAKTCKVPAAPATELIKSAGRPPLNTPWMVEERKKKEIRAAKKSAIGAGPNSIGNKKFPQEQEGCLPFSKRPQPQSSSAQHSSAQPSSSQPSSSQPASSHPASSQPKRKTRSSSSQPTTATCVVTRARLQSLNNLTQ